jgi:Sigma-70 region 2
MPQSDWLAERFEEHRGRLRAVGYRMLGSLSDADDAIQEPWLRLHIHGEESLHARVPDPIVSQRQAIDPEHADPDGNNMTLRQPPSSAR